jgi:hypothetical protein
MAKGVIHFASRRPLGNSRHRDLTAFDTNWKKGSGATPLTIQDLWKPPNGIPSETCSGRSFFSRSLFAENARDSPTTYKGFSGAIVHARPSRLLFGTPRHHPLRRTAAGCTREARHAGSGQRGRRRFLCRHRLGNTSSGPVARPARIGYRPRHRRSSYLGTDKVDRMTAHYVSSWMVGNTEVNPETALWEVGQVG